MGAHKGYAELRSVTELLEEAKQRIRKSKVKVIFACEHSIPTKNAQQIPNKGKKMQITREKSDTHK